MTSGAAINNAPTKIAGFNESTFAMLRNNGAAWAGVSARDTTANIITKTAVGQFSPWSMGTAGPTDMRIGQFGPMDASAGFDTTPALALGALALCVVLAGFLLAPRRLTQAPGVPAWNV